jgi:hypothetical protein
LRLCGSRWSRFVGRKTGYGVALVAFGKSWISYVIGIVCKSGRCLNEIAA